MGLSMFKFLFMECSKWTLAPSFSLVGLGDREEAGRGSGKFGGPCGSFSSTFTSPPRPHLLCSTHRIWYKLKTKLGPRKTIQRERVSAQGPLPVASGHRAPHPAWGSVGLLWASGRAGSCSLCLPPPAPSLQTESPTFGGQICHWGSLC